MGAGLGRPLALGDPTHLCVPPQDKLDQAEYQEVSTEEQREDISGKLKAASTWLEDEGFEATTMVRASQATAAAVGVRVRSWV